MYPLNKIKFQKGTSINHSSVDLLRRDTQDSLAIAKEDVTMKAECFGGVFWCFF